MMFLQTGDGLALVGQRCCDCGKVAFPRKRVCPECFGDDLQDQPLSKTGVLHTYTRTYVGAPHLPSPYVLGFVDVREGVRLLSLIVQCEPFEEVLRVGMPVEMVVGPLKKDTAGTQLYTYMFRPETRSAGSA
jgi:uncharacterized OB-fold protein